MTTEYYTYWRPHATVTINPSSLKGVKTGKIVTFSGASCSGKTTITDALGKSGRYHTISKMTSRKPRDKNSKEICVDSDTVKAIKQTGDFVYWMAYGGAHYLLPASPLLDCLATDLTVLADTPTAAAIGLKEHLPDQVITVFVDVPDREKTLIERMRKRGDSDTMIKKRLSDLSHIYASIDEFDVIVFNPDVPHGEPLPALQTLHSILEGK